MKVFMEGGSADDVVDESEDEGTITEGRDTDDESEDEGEGEEVETTEVEETEEDPKKAKPEEKKPDPKKDSVSIALTKVARKEKELRAKQGLIEEAEKSKKKYEDLEKEITDDPIAWLEKQGKSLDDIIKRELEGKKPVDPKVKALEDEMAKMKKEKEEAEAKVKKDAEDKLADDWRKSTSKLIEDKIDKFEYCSVADRDEVIEKAETILLDYFAETAKEDEKGQGKILDQETILSWIEEYYEGLDKKLSKAKKSKILRSAQSDEETEVIEDVEEVKKPQKTKAITRRLDADTPSSTGPLTPEERRKKALDLLK